MPNPKVKPVYDDAAHCDPFIDGRESAQEYEDLRRRMFDALQPSDEVERMMAADAVYYAWEAARGRRQLRKHIAACETEGLDAVLEAMGIDDDTRRGIVGGVAMRERLAVSRAESLLSVAGHDFETAQARAVALRVDEIGKLQALITAAEKRRDKLIRDVRARQRTRPRAPARTAADDSPPDD